MKIFSFKKPFLIIICLFIVFAGIGVVYSAAKERKGIIKFLNGPTPSITNAFIDKEKYFLGDTMAITAETKDAMGVKALVENEAGFNEVALVAVASFEGKATWQGKWKVENSLYDKKYKLKIIASNKSGITETVLEWIDPPNPGHSWSQIDGFPAACPANQFVTGIGTALTCASAGSVGGGVFEETSGYAGGININTYCASKGYTSAAVLEASLYACGGTIIGGRCNGDLYDKVTIFPASTIMVTAGEVNQSCVDEPATDTTCGWTAKTTAKYKFKVWCI